MKKPIIGIVSRPYITNNNRNVLCILETVRRTIIKAGGIPIMILPTEDMVYINNKEKPLTDLDKEILDSQIDLCDGILMPGGTFLYFYDMYICKRVNEKDIPLLGICMGMQVMCNYNNENKNIFIDGHKEPEKKYVHDVTIDKNSKLYSIIGQEKITVNSLHQTKVQNSGEYNTVATYEDVIEAVEKKDKKFNIGVQWHPEISYNDDEPSKKLIDAFINACKK